MSLWKHRIDIRDAWKKVEDDDGGPKALASVIIEKLRKIDFGPDFNYDRDCIIESLQNFVDDDKPTMREFDSILSELYDFGDTKLYSKFGMEKLLWIETF